MVANNKTHCQTPTSLQYSLLPSTWTKMRLQWKWTDDDEEEDYVAWNCIPPTSIILCTKCCDSIQGTLIPSIYLWSCPSSIHCRYLLVVSTTALFLLYGSWNPFVCKWNLELSILFCWILCHSDGWQQQRTCHSYSGCSPPFFLSGTSCSIALFWWCDALCTVNILH